jgi:lipoprotein-releasing system permease protein
MRVIAVTGIAIATATLVVTLSILQGFQKEYRRTILDFNAHIVMMEAGEVDDTGPAMRAVEEGRMDTEDLQFTKSHRLFLPAWRWFAKSYRAYSNLYYRIYERVPIGSWAEPFFDKLRPPRESELFPKVLTGWRDQARELDHKGITGITPFIYREGLLIAHGTIKGVIVKGIDSETFRTVNPMKVDLVPQYKSLDDALHTKLDAPPVILGKWLAKGLGIEDLSEVHMVRLLVPTESLARGEKNFQELSVVGFFESGLYDYDAQFALMSIPRLRSLFGVPKGRITGIELKLDNPDKAILMSKWLERKLMGSWRIIPWSELNAEIFRAVQLERRTFSIIMGMLVIVASFNIIGVLVLIILVRMHEISVLRSLGMTPRQLSRIFTRGGVVIGLIGVSVGIGLGIVLSLVLQRFEIVRIEPEIYFLSRLPIDISPLVCGMIAIFCLAVCWLSSRTAAKKLANIPICEGLMKAY